MIPEIAVRIAEPPRARWRLSERHREWARELIRLSVAEFGGVADYRDLLLAYALEHVNGEYVAEIEDVAMQAGADFVEALAANLYYDSLKLLLGCTAFAVNSEYGPILARNMDWFSDGNRLSEFTTVVNFVGKTGQTRFQSVGWPGHVGVLSGIATGRFAVTLNAALSEEPMQEATSIAFLIREVCQASPSFHAAVDELSKRDISSDCILLVTGTETDEMVVIERTPTRHAIRTADNGFIVATNDYRALDCNSVHATGVIHETTCRRFDAATHRLNSRLPASEEQCFAVLNDKDVKMRITVQQMVMCATSGKLLVSTAHQV